MSRLKPRVDVLRGTLVDDGPAYGGFALADVPRQNEGSSPPLEVPSANGQRSTASFDASAVRIALARPLARQKWNIEAPRPLMQQVARLSYVGGELLGRKRVNEYHILLGALLSLPDPDDRDAVEAFLMRVASAVEDFAD
jgi:hypothetical protein